MSKLLKVNDLQVDIPTESGNQSVIKNLSFNLEKGEMMGIVGESGSGKSITSLSIMRLLPRQAQISKGNIEFKDRDLVHLSEREMTDIRGKNISMIFQEPMTSLNPVLTIGEQVIEHVTKHLKLNRHSAWERARSMLCKVGLNQSDKILRSYPHQLSGGMKQRVMIAIALICNAELLIADEPTTALDVTIQAQILKLIKDMNKEYNTSVLFISHDLNIVKYLCDKIAVMYCGEILEQGEGRKVLTNPAHPYTEGLVRSIPKPGSRGVKLETIPGRVPNLEDRSNSGCVFASRCSKKLPQCEFKSPSITWLNNEHSARCHLLTETRREVAW